MFNINDKIEWHGNNYEVRRIGKKFYTLVCLHDTEYNKEGDETTVYIKWINEAAKAA